MICFYLSSKGILSVMVMGLLRVANMVKFTVGKGSGNVSEVECGDAVKWALK